MTAPKVNEIKFVATPDKGEVSALLMRPRSATHLLVLGHGASSNMRTPMLQAIAEALAAEGIATLRYNFPYSENKRGRDSKDVCTVTVRSAVRAAREAAHGLPVLAGGHSFSGRMTSTAASEAPLDGVDGLGFSSRSRCIRQANRRHRERSISATSPCRCCSSQERGTLLPNFPSCNRSWKNWANVPHSIWWIRRTTASRY